VHGVKMIKYITLFFGYCFSLKLTSSTVWFRDLTAKFKTKLKGQKENEQNSTLKTNNEDKKLQRLQKVLQLLDEEDPSENEVRMLQKNLNGISDKKDSSYFKEIFCLLLVVIATMWITIKPYSSDDIYIWYYLTFIFLFIVWNNFTTCTQVPMYILVFILREKLCRLFPFRLTSRLVGRISDIKLPVKLRKFVFGLYVKSYHVNMQEACIQDLNKYESMAQFFRRQIKTEYRPICQFADLTSPCDGTVVYHGSIQDGYVRQVKGMCFSLKELLGSNQQGLSDVEYSQQLLTNSVENELRVCVIYLAPGDYHRFHSPADCQLKSRTHVAGELISVRPNLLAWLPQLFVVNERVALTGNYRNKNFLSVVAVGATNVGSVRVYHDEKLRTNLFKDRVGSTSFKKYDQFVLGKGDSLGEFRFGSTIIVVYESPKSNVMVSKVGSKVKYGQAMSIEPQYLPYLQQDKERNFDELF